jgi:hypothetical protein
MLNLKKSNLNYLFNVRDAFFSLTSRNSSATLRSDESGSSDAADKIRDALQAYDEKLRRQRPRYICNPYLFVLAKSFPESTYVHLHLLFLYEHGP